MKISLPLNIEIPSNPTDFNLGLMFRESLDQNSGMLFVFEEMGQKSFHMKDTKIPLDIAFVKEDGTIESIKELLPLSVIPISSNGQVLYALEVNRGWFKENNIEGIIIGNPINMDGSLGRSAQSVNDVATNISKAINIPIILWDERLSTVGAFNLSSELDVNVSKREKDIDKFAAAFILQGALDFIQN